MAISGCDSVNYRYGDLVLFDVNLLYSTFHVYGLIKESKKVETTGVFSGKHLGAERISPIACSTAVRHATGPSTSIMHACCADRFRKRARSLYTISIPSTSMPLKHYVAEKDQLTGKMREIVHAYILASNTCH